LTTADEVDAFIFPCGHHSFFLQHHSNSIFISSPFSLQKSSHWGKEKNTSRQEIWKGYWSAMNQKKLILIRIVKFSPISNFFQSKDLFEKTGTLIDWFPNQKNSSIRFHKISYLSVIIRSNIHFLNENAATR
jgi:hypothetical protein